MSEPVQLRDALINVFPKLTPKDFPEVLNTESLTTWFNVWLEEFPESEKYVASGHVKDWLWELEDDIGQLDIANKYDLDLSTVVQRISYYLSGPGDEDEQELETDHDDEDDLDGETEIDPDTYRAICLENVLDELLKKGINAITVELDQQIILILSDANAEQLDVLTSLISDVYPEGEVNFYQAELYPSHYDFENILE
ncbi:hypothetical protein [Acinetobacter populi]|uniref:Uncharacterized protein n=1 Tax=Acinetobacter populi TaxID=1582270 RepID=A0A1Z9YY53_9GAMM|nr:hypothetical protein [Acinetobacter populi]OUY07146.1 hypothetical protein CAP51_10700 [Acinetobacter populi]